MVRGTTATATYWGRDVLLGAEGSGLMTHRRTLALVLALGLSLTACGGDEATGGDGDAGPDGFCEQLESAVTDEAFLDLESSVPEELAGDYHLIRTHAESGSGEPPDESTQAAYRSLIEWSSKHCEVDLAESADPEFVPVTRASTTVVIPPRAEVEPAPLEVTQAEGHWVSEDGLADLTIGSEGATELRIHSGREFACNGIVAHSTLVHRYEAIVSSPVVCTPSSSDDPVGEVEGVLELILDPERDTMELVEIPGGVSGSPDAEPVTACGDVSSGGLIAKGAFYSGSCVLQRG